MAQSPACPQCKSEVTYFDGSLNVCPLCSFEWADSEHLTGDSSQEVVDENQSLSVKDANGNALQDGDSVTVIKDLKIKGASGAVKGGTKVRNIRLVADPGDGHNIVCKIDGIGSIHLKSEFVRKVKD